MSGRRIQSKRIKKLDFWALAAEARKTDIANNEIRLELMKKDEERMLKQLGHKKSLWRGAKEMLDQPKTTIKGEHVKNYKRLQAEALEDGEKLAKKIGDSARKRKEIEEKLRKLRG